MIKIIFQILYLHQYHSYNKRVYLRHGNVQILLLALSILWNISLSAEVDGNVDVLLRALSVELGPGLAEDGRHGPLPDPLPDSLLEDLPDLRPVADAVLPHLDLVRSVQPYPQRHEDAPLGSPLLPSQTRTEQSREGAHPLPQPRPAGIHRLGECQLPRPGHHLHLDCLSSFSGLLHNS